MIALSSSLTARIFIRMCPAVHSFTIERSCPCKPSATATATACVSVSVILTDHRSNPSMLASFSAFPYKCSSGSPYGPRRTSISCQRTQPIPLPSAFETASLTAKRPAKAASDSPTSDNSWGVKPAGETGRGSPDAGCSSAGFQPYRPLFAGWPFFLFSGKFRARADHEQSFWIQVRAGYLEYLPGGDVSNHLRQAAIIV
jgi:hypothetical protein